MTATDRPVSPTPTADAALRLSELLAAAGLETLATRFAKDACRGYERVARAKGRAKEAGR
jgi:hypothetical protein